MADKTRRVSTSARKAECGIQSMPHTRYQSRRVIFPFRLLLVVVESSPL